MGANGNTDFTESLEELRACEGENTAFQSDRAIAHRAGSGCGWVHKSCIWSSQSEFQGVGRGPQSPIYSWGAMKVGDYGEREDQFGSEMRPLVTCPYSRALCTCYQHLTNSGDLKKILQGMEYDWFVSKYVIIMHEILNNTKHKTIYTREQTKANQLACSSPDQKKRRLLCRGFHHQNHHPLFLLNFSDGAVVRTQLLLLRGLSRR